MTLEELRAWRHERLLRLFALPGDPQTRQICEQLDLNWFALTELERALLTVRFGLRPGVPARSCCKIALQCRTSESIIRLAVAETLAKLTPCIIDERAFRSLER